LKDNQIELKFDLFTGSCSDYLTVYK